MLPDEEYKVIRITDERFLDVIVELHLEAFKYVLSGQIGKTFLRKYYKSILDKGFIYGVITKEQIVGFVSGIINESELSDLKYYFWAGFGILSHLFSFTLIRSLFRHFKRLKSFRDVELKSELLSIAVSETMRGKGIGISLVKALEKFFSECKVDSYKVFTDTKYSTGYKLYEKLGFQLFREVDLYGLPFRMYISNINVK